MMFPNDSGPIYKETLEGGFPVEPWNTASNLIFLFILIYWSLKVYPMASRHLFLAWSLPVLLIGYIGGTMFHGTRSHEAWLLMDWVPIMVLCMAAVVHFIFKITRRWMQRLGILILIFAVSFGVRTLPLPPKISVSLMQ